MKNFLIFIFLLFVASVLSGQQTCFTPAQVAPVALNLNPDPLQGDYCVTAYVEVDNDIVTDKGPQGSRIYVDNLLEEVSALYAAQDITVNWEVRYWDSPSPYTATTTSGLLTQFREQTAAAGGYDGDVAHLLTYRGSGGIAYVDVICRQSFGHAVSSIQPTYRDYPAYSWSVEVVAHELGHNLGSPHTQSCVWNGNNTAIDGCSPFGTEGGCDDPGFPNGGGTVMSYCHLQGSVGINFLKGFHEQPLALIKNRIANAQCVECVDDPDDPVDPDTCAGNQIIVELQLDNYPTETSWEVLDSGGEAVAVSDQFDKLQMNTYHADTLCLPDGCYSFVIKDVDGLSGYGCSEGMYVVNGPNGELASGQAFTNEESTRFCFGVTPPDSNCLEVVLRKDSLSDYANQSRFPFPLIIDIGTNGVEVYSNNWRAMPKSYTLSPNSIVTLDATNVTTGEIQGIALVNNISGIWPARSFRFAGTQNWGIPVEQVAEGETKTITIPVGQYFTGDITHIVLINDDDHRGLVRTRWENVEICEGEAVTKALLSEPEGKSSDEFNGGGWFKIPDEFGKIKWADPISDKTAFMITCAVLHMDENGNIIPCPDNKAAGISPGNWIKAKVKSLRADPNPVFDTLTINSTEYKMYSAFGELVRAGKGNKIDMTGLEPGAYFLISPIGSRTIIKQ